MISLNRKKQVQKTARIFVAVILFFSTEQAVSAIPYRSSFEHMDVINKQTKELDLSMLARIQILIDANRFNMADYVPLSGLPENSSGDEIARRILKQTMNTLMDSDFVTASPTLNKVEKINSSFVTTVERSGHSFNFRLKPVETVAQMNYKGFVSAVLSYDMSEDELKFEISKEIGQKTYAFTHVDNGDDSSDKIGIRWAF